MMRGASSTRTRTRTRTSMRGQTEGRSKAVADPRRRSPDGDGPFVISRQERVEVDEHEHPARPREVVSDAEIGLQTAVCDHAPGRHTLHGEEAEPSAGADV